MTSQSQISVKFGNQTSYNFTSPMFSLTLIYMSFFEPSVMGGGGGGMRPPYHNFVAIAPMITKLGTDIKLDVFYTMVTKKFVTSLLLRNYDVITCILANA